MAVLTHNDFNYDRNNEYEIAEVTPTMRVRIVRDSDEEDPFEGADGHWPMLVVTSHIHNIPKLKVETSKAERWGVESPMHNWFSEAQLIHNQRHIFKIMSVPDVDVLARYETRRLDAEQVIEMMDEYPLEAHEFDERAELFEMAGVIALSTTVTGYSQGDWADLLIIAPPSMQRDYSVTDEALVRKSLEAQAELYRAWAFGDVYGYVIEEMLPRVDPEDASDEDWSELVEGGSCWGFYGDHDESGIIDAINDNLPVKETINVGI
jgi:hypothetical protein